MQLLDKFLASMNEQAQTLVNDILPPKAETNEVDSAGFKYFWAGTLVTQHCDVCIMFQTFDMEPLVANCTLDVVCDSVMGLNVDAQHNATSEFYSRCRLPGEPRWHAWS